MAFNFKTATPDETIPNDGFIMGADSQEATTPSLYPISAFDARVDAAITEAIDGITGGGSGGGAAEYLAYILDGAATLAYLPASRDVEGVDTPYAVNDVFRTSFWDSDREECSQGQWRIAASNNLGPVGTIGYRTFYGATIAGSPNLLTTLSALGFTNGQTVTVNSNTVTALTSGASGNNQVNLSDRLKDLLLKLSFVTATSLGDAIRFDLVSSRVVIESADINAIVTNNLTFAGTGLTNIGLAAGSYTLQRGITMEGSNWRFELMPGPQGIVDIRSIGVKCDGVTVADYRTLRRVAYACAARGYKLVNNYGSKGNVEGARFKITRTLDLRRCSCDLRIQAGTAVDAATSQQDGDFFDEAAYLDYLDDLAAWVIAGSIPEDEPVNPNIGIELQSFSDWNTATDGFTAGDTRYMGIAVMGAGDASNSWSCRQYIDVRGDGNFDFTTRPTCVGVHLANDNACMGKYQVAAPYCGISVVLHNNLEKCEVDIASLYAGWVVYLDPTGSTTPDTLKVRIRANDYNHLIWEEDGTDTSVWWDVLAESRSDPGDGSPNCWFRNSKFGKLTGQMRALNGEKQLLIDKSSNVGVDTFSIDLDTIHSHQNILTVRRLRNLMGHLRIKDCDGTAPIVHLMRVGNASDFHCSIVAARNTGLEALAIGYLGTDVSANGLFSIDAHLGTYNISRNVDRFPFASDGTEVSDATKFRFNELGCRIYKMKGGCIEFKTMYGGFQVDADCIASESGNPQIFVHRQWSGNTGVGRYGAVIDGAAAVDFISYADGLFTP